MSVAKIVLLLIYAALAVLAFTQGETSLGAWSLRLLVGIAAVHVVEMLVFFKLCKSAGGSLPGHLLSVFVFGVLHANELKAKQAAA
jgi:uncharacterized protein YhhL (DUF1145 family)